MGDATKPDKPRRVPARGRALAPPAPIERRIYRPAQVGELLPAITRAAYRRRSPATAGLLEAWPRIAGAELASLSAPRRCVAGTLTIACLGPAALELQHRTAQLIDRANRILGPDTVLRLRIVQDAPDLVPAAAPPPQRVQPEPITLPDLPEGPLRTALERLGAHLNKAPPR